MSIRRQELVNLQAVVGDTKIAGLIAFAGSGALRWSSWRAGKDFSKMRWTWGGERKLHVPDGQESR
jgi:hypothetical protein